MEYFTLKTHEKDIQREIGRYTEGFVDVQMISDTKVVVYIDDKDVPAAIGKGGKNISAIVNKIGIGIDIKPRSEFDRQQCNRRKVKRSSILVAVSRYKRTRSSLR